MNGKFNVVEMSNCYFHHGFLFQKKKVMKAEIRYRIAGFLFCDRQSQHAEVFPCKDGAQSRRDSRVTGDFQGPAAIDGSAQISQKCHAGWACLDMFAHLFAGKRFHSAIQVFGKVGKQIPAFRRTLSIRGLGNLSLPRGGSRTVLIFRTSP